MARPKTYRSMEDFEREELRPGEKIGFSLDDVYQDWAINKSDVLSDEDPMELDFENADP